MKLKNASTETINPVTITNNNGTQNFDGPLARNSSQTVQLSPDFTYEVCGTFQEKPVCVGGLVSGVTVTFLISKGKLHLQID